VCNVLFMDCKNQYEPIHDHGRPDHRLTAITNYGPGFPLSEPLAGDRAFWRVLTPTSEFSDNTVHHGPTA
jgi:hypothetical protein